MHDQIREVVAEVFSMPVAELPPDPNPDTIEGWDSLHHFELMLELENRFGVQISSEAMPELLSVEAIADYLQR